MHLPVHPTILHIHLLHRVPTLLPRVATLHHRVATLLHMVATLLPRVHILQLPRHQVSRSCTITIIHSSGLNNKWYMLLITITGENKTIAMAQNVAFWDVVQLCFVVWPWIRASKDISLTGQ